MAGARAAGPDSTDDASASDLVKPLSEQTSRLVQQEMELAKAELSEKGKQAGIGAGLFGGAGVFGLYALGALTATIIAALSLAMDTWLAALIVTVLWAAVAGVMALVGKTPHAEERPADPRAERRKREGGRAMDQDERAEGAAMSTEQHRGDPAPRRRSAPTSSRRARRSATRSRRSPPRPTSRRRRTSGSTRSRATSARRRTRSRPRRRAPRPRAPSRAVSRSSPRCARTPRRSCSAPPCSSRS